MKKTSLILAAALSCIAMSAAAGGSHGSQGSQGAAGGGGGGGGGGAGFGVGIASASASSRTQVGIATTVGLGVTTGATTANGGLGFGGNSSALGGAGGMATGGSIAAGAVQIGGTVYKAAASPSFAPGAHGPLKSCRLYAGLGAGSRDGTGSAGIPIGNDQVCITDANHEIMDRENARVPGTFSRDDYLRASCKVEGMSETQACKALAGQQQTAAAPVGMAYTPN